MNIFKKTFTFIMLGLLTFAIVACADEDYSWQYEIFDSIVIPERISDNVSLPTRVEGFDNTIFWTSSNHGLATASGLVIRPHVDTDMYFEAFAHFGTRTVRRQFNTTVLGHASPEWTASQRFQSVHGFAYSQISNRSTVAADARAVVRNEVEFLLAFANTSISVIEIAADLNMGFDYVLARLRAALPESEVTRLTNPNLFRRNDNHPMLHPRLLRYGVSQLRIRERNGLMIFSQTGNTISHMTTRISYSSDIVFRNLHLTGIWEWDDDMAGSYDDLDWDYFTVENTDGLWLDHLTLDQAYDGLLDARLNSVNMTFSYLKLNFVPNDFMREQIEYLEQSLIVEGRPGRTASNSRYMRMRQYVSMETILEYASTQMKGFNLGNTTAGSGFEGITATFHHIYARNLRDRLPRLRRGDVHLFNVYNNHSDIARLRAATSLIDDFSITSQALVPTEQGAILMENSMLVDVAQPIRDHQDAFLDPDFTGRWQVQNSVLRNGINTFLGGSGDTGSPWTRSNQNIHWRLPFFFRNHQVIPYLYRDLLIDPFEVRNALVDNGVGAGARDDDFNWLAISVVASRNRDVNPRDFHMIDQWAMSMPDILIDINATRNPEGFFNSGVNGQTGLPMTFPFRQTVRNFYPNPTMIEGVDFSLTVDHSRVNWQQPGSYNVHYHYQSLVNDWDRFTLIQTLILFDSNGPNEIFNHDVTPEFDGTVNINVNTFVPTGQLFILLSNTATMSADNIINLGQVHDLTSIVTNLDDFKIGDATHIHMITVRDGLRSAVVSERLRRETVVRITTPQEFDSMLQRGEGSRNHRFILENDLDFSNHVLSPILPGTPFMGVFDGQGFALRNINQDRNSGGIFAIIDHGLIRNLVLDNIHLTITGVQHRPDPEENPEHEITLNPSDDAGILARQVRGWGHFENIVVRNSSLDSHANYAAAFVGRVRSGWAYFGNLAIIDTDLHLQEVSVRYLGGFLGGADPNTTVVMENLYANGMRLEHNNDMIGAVVGRLRGDIEIRNVVLNNVDISGRHNIGIISGKDEPTVTRTVIENIFADVTMSLVRFNADGFSRMYGYILGNFENANIPLTVVRNMFAFEISGPNINFGDGTGPTSSGLNVHAGLTIMERSVVINQAWFEANLSEIVNNAVWTFVNGNLVLINTI